MLCCEACVLKMFLVLWAVGEMKYVFFIHSRTADDFGFDNFFAFRITKFVHHLVRRSWWKWIDLPPVSLKDGCCRCSLLIYYLEFSRLVVDCCFLLSGLFGICNYGVDINGYTNDPEKGLCIWLQKRSLTKQRWPGKWDNMVFIYWNFFHQQVVCDKWEYCNRSTKNESFPIGFVDFCNVTRIK